MSYEKSTEELSWSEISLQNDGCTEVIKALEFRIPQREVFIKAFFSQNPLSAVGTVNLRLILTVWMSNKCKKRPTDRFQATNSLQVRFLVKNKQMNPSLLQLGLRGQVCV